MNTSQPNKLICVNFVNVKTEIILELSHVGAGEPRAQLASLHPPSGGVMSQLMDAQVTNLLMSLQT